MARPSNKYTNPENGETLTTKGWCKKLKISDSQLKRRISMYGEAAKAFEPKVKPPPSSQEWQSWEREFLKECSADTAWTLKEIAKKLERTIDSVHEEMRRMGISNAAGRRPSINWLYIWRMHQEGLSLSATGRVMGTAYQTVRHAINRMEKMDPDELDQFFANCGYI